MDEDEPKALPRKINLQEDEAAVIIRGTSAKGLMYGCDMEELLRQGKEIPPAVKVAMVLISLTFPDNKDLWEEMQRRTVADVKTAAAKRKGPH